MACAEIGQRKILKPHASRTNDRLFEDGIFDSQAVEFEQPLDRQEHHIALKGFHQKLCRAGLHGLDRKIDAAIAGHHHTDHAPIELACLLKQADAILVRQFDVGNHKRSGSALQRGERLRADPTARTRYPSDCNSVTSNS